MGGRPSSDARWVITSGLFSAVFELVHAQLRESRGGIPRGMKVFIVGEITCFLCRERNTNASGFES